MVANVRRRPKPAGQSSEKRTFNVRHNRQCKAARRQVRVNGGAVPLNGLKLLLRNALFIPLMLAHGFRRLLPPY